MPRANRIRGRTTHMAFLDDASVWDTNVPVFDDSFGFKLNTKVEVFDPFYEPRKSRPPRTRFERDDPV